MHNVAVVILVELERLDLNIYARRGCLIYPPFVLVASHTHHPFTLCFFSIIWIMILLIYTFS